MSSGEYGIDIIGLRADWPSFLIWPFVPAVQMRSSCCWAADHVGWQGLGDVELRMSLAGDSRGRNP